MTRLAVGRPTLAVSPKTAPKAISEGLKQEFSWGDMSPHVPHPLARASRASCDQSRAHWNPPFQNPGSATDDYYSCHQNLATCYQLVQSVLKIGSALAERMGQGEVGGCITLGDSAWWLLQLAIQRAWSALAEFR